MDKKYACPCCGYLMFDEPSGTDRICDICFWEDEKVSLIYGNEETGGPNKVSLVTAQENYRKFGAKEFSKKPFVRRPGPDDRRDPNWRPIDLKKDKFGGPRNAVPNRGHLSYWQDEYWLRDWDGQSDDLGRMEYAARRIRNT